MQNQQGSIDSTRESLNTLCRKYPSEELAGLGSALTDLIKSYESVNQLSARTLASLQHCLQQHFNGEVPDDSLCSRCVINILYMGVLHIKILCVHLTLRDTNAYINGGLYCAD